MCKSEGPAHTKDTGGGTGRRGEMSRKPGVCERRGHVMDEDVVGGGGPQRRTEVPEHQAEAPDQLLLPLLPTHHLNRHRLVCSLLRIVSPEVILASRRQGPHIAMHPAEGRLQSRRSRSMRPGPSPCWVAFGKLTESSLGCRFTIGKI